MGNTFENTKFKVVYFESEKIVEFYMKDIEIDRADILEMHTITMVMTKGDKYATIFSAEDFFSISGEARAEGAKAEYSEHLIAQALIVKNLAQRLIGNFIMKINKPVRDTRMFSNYEDGKLWVIEKVRQEEKKKTGA